MAVDGIYMNRRHRGKQEESILRVSTIFILSVENEQADAGRNCRTCHARSNSQTRTGDREKTIFPVQLITSRILATLPG